MSKQPITYVALLRGINVGGNNLMSMADLKQRFEGLGYTNVKTFINSGNIIFRSPQLNQRKLEAEITTVLPKAVKVLVFSLAQIDAIMHHVPKSWHTGHVQKCNVIFLHHEVDKPTVLEGLQPKPGIEELHYYPGVLFWSANMDTITKSNMLKLSANPVYMHMTVRIYNSVRKIHALMQAADKS